MLRFPWYPIEPIEIDAENKAEMKRMGMIAVADHNKEKGSNLEFDSVVSASHEFVFDNLYHLDIKVKGGGGGDQGKEKIIHKMVWKGVSREVIEVIKKKCKTSSLFPPRASCQHRQLANVALEAIIISTLRGRSLTLEDVTFRFLEKERKGGRTVGAGYFRSNTYKFRFVVPPQNKMENAPLPKTRSRVQPPQNKEEAEESVTDVTLLETSWIQTIDDIKARSFIIDHEEALLPLPLKRPPPLGQKRRRRQVCCSCNDKRTLSKLDLRSPLIQTMAWVLVENHNIKEGGKLIFVEVLDGELLDGNGFGCNLTLRLSDEWLPKVLKMYVWRRPWLGLFWASPLTDPTETDDEKPGETDDETPGETDDETPGVSVYV